jgi:lysophospholipase L1-like esterase
MKKFLLNILAVFSVTAGALVWADDKPAVTGTFDVVFIGDSITAGSGLPDPKTQAAPVIAGADLQKELGDGAAVYISNRGHSGHTTVDFQPGGKDFSGVESAAKDLEAAHPGQLVFSIMIGTNDSANAGPKGAPVSAADYGHNLQLIIDALLAEFPDAKFVIHHATWYSPNTHNTSDYEGDSAANRLKSYFPAIDSLVAHYASSNPGHVFLGDVKAYDYFENHTEEMRAENGKDGVFHLHPNATGAQSLAGFWATALAEKLRQ